MRKLIGSLFIIGSLSTLVQAAPFVNGDFESGDSNGWSVLPSANAQALYGGLSAPPFGTVFAGFNGGDAANTGVLSQTFDTVIGQSYSVQFSAGNLNASGGPSTQSVLAEALNASSVVIGSLPVSIFTAVNTNSSLVQVYAGSPYTFSFVATSLMSTLRFTDTGSQTISTDLFLDNISVTESVPELNAAGAAAPLAILAIAFLVLFSGKGRQVVPATNR